MHIDWSGFSPCIPHTHTYTHQHPTLGRRGYRGDTGDVGSDGDQVLLEQALLVGDLVSMGRLLLVLLHLLAGHVQHTLQLVLWRGATRSCKHSNKPDTDNLLVTIK